MSFLKAVIDHFREIGLYDIDWIDLLAWMAFGAFVVIMVLTGG